MRLLFLTHRMPYPPDKGEKIRAFHELKYLCANHEVDLFCLADSATELAYVPELKRLCRHIYVETPAKVARLLREFLNFVSGQPISFGYFESSHLRKAIGQALTRRRYDLVFVNCSSMAQYIPPDCGIPLMVDFVDADSNKFFQYASRSGPLMRWFYALEGTRVAEAEYEISRRAELSLVVTTNDAAELGRGSCSPNKVKVLPMGVELPAPLAIPDPSAASHQPFVLFLGTMSYWPNADAAAYFAEEIYPRVRQRNPELKFVIAGRDPGRRIRSLGRIPGVIVAGAVPDAFAYFRASLVSVAPFRISQGFQSKIAESLAVGTPVVASSRAANAIGLSEKEGLFTADTPAAFAGRVCELVDCVAFRKKLRNGSELVQKQLGWNSRLNCLDRWVTEVAHQNAGETFASLS